MAERTPTSVQKKEYIIFPCPRCGIYTFSPTNKKTRKCSGCGLRIKISELEPNGESITTVYGLTEANKKVRIYNYSVSVNQNKNFERIRTCKNKPAEYNPDKTSVLRPREKNRTWVEDEKDRIKGRTSEPYAERFFKPKIIKEKKGRNNRKIRGIPDRYSDEFGRVLDAVYEWQRNERIDPSEGYPFYVIEIIITDVIKAPYIRPKVRTLLACTPYLKKLANGYVYLEKHGGDRYYVTNEK